MEFNLSRVEAKLYQKLNTPQKIQDYLNTLAIHPSHEDNTSWSPRLVMRHKQAHCMEGALLAASVLWYHGHPPLLLDLVAHATDYDHVVVPFKQGGYWGAISKTNYSVLRWRDPVYLSIRELVMSYFHEYYLPDGTKSLWSFSKPFNLKQLGKDWVTAEKSLLYIAEKLDKSPHEKIIQPGMQKNLRRAEKIEIKAGDLVVWQPGKRPRRMI